MPPLVLALSRARTALTQDPPAEPTSHLGNLSLVLGSVAIGYVGMQQYTRDSLPSMLAPHPASLPEFFGIVVFTTTAHCEAIVIQQSMRRPAAYPRVLDASFVAIAATYLVFGCAVFIIFGHRTRDIVVNNLHTDGVPTLERALVILVKSCLCMSLLFQYPITLFPASTTTEQAVAVVAARCRRRAYARAADRPPGSATVSDPAAADALLLHEDSVDEARLSPRVLGAGGANAGPKGSRSPGVETECSDSGSDSAPRQRGHLPYWATFAVRSALVLLTALLAAAVPKFELVASFVGSFANGLVAYMLPPLLYMRLCRPQGARPGAWTAADVFHAGLFVLLTLGSLYSAGVVFWALVDPS